MKQSVTIIAFFLFCLGMAFIVKIVIDEVLKPYAKHISPICNLRDYQLDVYNDTIYLYDGEDSIGKFFYEDSSELGKLILKDNQ